MNKNIIFSAVFLVLGFTGGLFLTQKYKPVIDNQEQEIVLSEQEVDKSKISSSKLFEFMNSFGDYSKLELDTTILSPGSIIKIPDIQPILGVMTINHRTSPESNSYSVYDYKNDVLYKDIGYGRLGDIFTPMSFVNNHSVVMSRVHSESERTLYPLSVKDLRDGSLKELPIKIDIQTRDVVTQADYINNLVYVYVNINTPKNETSRYTLDTKTLEVTKIK